MNNHHSALIGCTGFVGSTLQKQTRFASLYRSTNIGQIDGRAFDTVVCAGAPAQKWLANREPEADRSNIEGLIDHLRTVECRTFILISTVDVFRSPVEVYEDSPVEESGLHPYGLHRRLLERFVQSRFPDHLIVRLPGLVGAGLRKNVLFDLLNEHNLEAIESRSVYQFYPMVRLWADIQTALHAGLRLVHLTAEPLSVARVCRHGFGRRFDQTLRGAPARYDMRTRHGEVFASGGHYLYNRRQIIQAIRAYVRTEPVARRAAGARA